MSIKDLAVWFLQRQLSRFVKNVEDVNVRGSIFGGHLHLGPLDVKPEALADLGWPVQVTMGVLEEFDLRIPWSTIFSTGNVSVRVRGLYVVVEPNEAKPYDADLEARVKELIKRKQIEQIEEAAEEYRKQQTGESSNQSWSIWDTVLNYALRHIELTFENIHILYRDKVSVPKKPFVIGITLKSLTVQSTAADTKSKQPDLVSKLLTLKALSLYWNSSSETVTWQDLKDKIPCEDNITPEHCYILKPIALETLLVLNRGYSSEPKFSAEINLDHVSLRLSHTQFRDLVKMFELWELMKVNAEYRKFRPLLPLKRPTSPIVVRKWWMYAITGVRETNNKRWSPSRISHQWRSFRKYLNHYKNYLTDESIPESSLCGLEKDLSAASICLARVEAEKQLSPDLSKSETRETSIFSSLTSLSDSIWSWLGYETSSSPSRRRGYADFFDLLSPSDREQMYRAIGHDLTLTSVKNNADYVKWSVRLSLRHLDVALERQQHLAASAHLRGIDVVIKNIPVHERIDVAAEVNDIEVRGSSAKLSGTDEPVLLSMIKSDHSDKLFRFDLRTNPCSSDADALIVVQLSPVEIVLDVPTLSELGKLFTVDEANYADGFLRYAESKLDEFRTQAAVNLLYALEKAKIVVVDIDLKSPSFILPENGRATATTTGIRALVLDLGRLSVRQLSDRADLRKVDSPFLRYDVNLANGRILVVGARDDWRRALDDSANDSSLDLLPPMSFLVRLFQSVEATTNPLIARLKVEANVDELCVRANDEKLIEALTLLTSVAKHFDAPPPSTSCGEFKTSYHDTLKSDIAAVREAIHDDDTASFHTANDNFSDDDAVDGASSTFRGQSLVDVNLVMNRFALDVDRNAVAYVRAELTGLVVRVSVRRDNWDASVRLKGVEIVDAQRRAVVKDDDGPLRLVHAKTLVDDFIVVSVSGCDRRSTAYTGWEWEASVDVGEIDVTVHRQSLFDLRAFYDRLVWNENVLSRAVSRLEIDSSPEPEPEPKSAAAAAEKKIDSWRITARLKTVKIDVADDRLCVATISVRDVRGATSVSGGDGRAVEAKLRSVDVTNGGAATMYREVISMGRTRDHLFSVSLRRRGDGDETTLALSVGRVNVVYLHRFFADLYALARSFTDAWARLAKATAVASETARVRVVELERAGSPIRLEILVDSPAVLVPTSVSSTNAFFVSVGNLSLKNFDGEATTRCVEHYRASFAGLSLYRRAGNWKRRRVLLSPIEVRLEATRRLDGAMTATTTTTPPPRFQVWGEVDRVNFNLGKEDYVYIREALRDNLGEKSAVKREESPTPSSPLPVVTVVEEDFPDRGNGGLLLKCRFSVKRLQVVLYADEPPLTPDTRDRSASAKFASLVVDDVQVDGRENGGGRRRIEARVRAVTVRDCRPNRHGAIKDIIRHSETDQMFLIDYETRDEWDKTKLKMAKIRLCFCLKFFRKLRDFFETETTDGEGAFDASQFGRYLARNAGHAAAQLLTLDETDGTDSEATKRTIEFVCPAIEIVVPEKAKTTNCSALALSANFDGKIESHRGVKRIGVVAKSLNVVSYVFNTPRRTSIQLVRPFDADVEGLVTNSKQIIGVSVSKIEATLYHSALLTIDSLWKSFRRHGDDDDDVDLPPSSSNPFKAEPVDVTQWRVSTPVRMPPIRRAQIDQQLVVRTNGVSVIFQTPEQNVYRPALAVEVDVVFELRDWSHYPTAGADATLELKYYNARVETWEPLVEPVEFGEEGLYRPWAVSLCFIQYLNKPLLFGDVRVEDELIQNTLGFDSSARRSSRSSSSSSFVSGGAGGLLVSPNLAPRRNNVVMETTESRSDDGELDETDGGDLHSSRTARLDSRHDDDDGDASSSLTVCNCVVVTSFEPLQIVVSAIGLNALSTAHDRWSRDTLSPQRHSFFHPSLDAVTLYVSNAIDDCDATIVPEAWIASSSSDYCVPRAGGAIELACRATDRSKRLSLVHTTNDASSSPAPKHGNRLYARWVSGGETSHSLTHEEDGISVEGSVESPLDFDRGLTNSPWVLPGESSQDTSNRASPTVGIVEVNPSLVFKTSASAVLPPRRIGSDADCGRLAFDGFGAISEEVGIVEEEEEEDEGSLGDHFPDGGGDDDEPSASQRRRPSEILDDRHLFKIKIGNGSVKIPVDRDADILMPVATDTLNGSALCSVRCKSNGKFIDIKSPLQIRNSLNCTVEVTCTKGNDPQHVMVVKQGDIESVPLRFAFAGNIFITPEGYRKCEKALTWSPTGNVESELLCCSSQNGDTSPPFVVHVSWREIDCKTASMRDQRNWRPAAVVMQLQSPLTLENQLPFSLLYQLEGSQEEFATLERGTEVKLAVLTAPTFKIRINDYQAFNWAGRFEMTKEVSDESKVPLKMFAENSGQTRKLRLAVFVSKSGVTRLTIYCSHWLINRAPLALQVRESSLSSHSLKPVHGQPLLISFGRRAKHKIYLRCDNRDKWSKDVSADAVGSTSIVACCTDKAVKHEMQVTCSLSSSSTLTRIIFVDPLTIVVNRTKTLLQFAPCRSLRWTSVKPSETQPFWPSVENDHMSVKYVDSRLSSWPFSSKHPSSFVLRMSNERPPISVTVREVDISRLVVLEPYYKGAAAVRLCNYLRDSTIEFHQQNCNQTHLLTSEKSTLYTWDEPLKPRFLHWNVSGSTEVIPPNSLLADGSGSFTIPPTETRSSSIVAAKDVGALLLLSAIPEAKEDAADGGGGSAAASAAVKRGVRHSSSECSKSTVANGNALEEEEEENDDRNETDRGRGDFFRRSLSKAVSKEAYWVCYMDGLQRTLLFTSDQAIAQKAAEVVHQQNAHAELFLSFNFLSLSFVDRLPREVAYLSLSSSVVWERLIVDDKEKPGFWTPLDSTTCALLEKARQEWEEDGTADFQFQEITVCFDSDGARMKKPFSSSLRRQFHPGFWLRSTFSDVGSVTQIKLATGQLDNQLDHPTYPVAAFSRKQIAPLFDFVMLKSYCSGSSKCRCIMKAELKPIEISVDRGFLFALWRIFDVSESDKGENLDFEKELAEILTMDARMNQAIQETEAHQRHLYEFLEISRIQAKVNASLDDKVSSTESRGGFDRFQSLLSSLGVSPSLKDVDISLNGLHRETVHLDNSELLSLISSHFYHQALSQLYKVVGIIVLGPWQGIVNELTSPLDSVPGPKGGKDDLLVSVRSALGHISGGAASVAGSVGQRIASLTFDKQFQRKRAKRLQRLESQSVGQNLKSGGQALAMGFIHGVTGLIRQPYKGARREGASGFFKGLGKGLVGTVARPAGGVMDMAAITLNTLGKNYSERDKPERVRPPRLCIRNKALQPYSAENAQLNLTVKALPMPYSLGSYVWHCNLGPLTMLILTTRHVLEIREAERKVSEDDSIDLSGIEYHDEDPVWFDGNTAFVAIKGKQRSREMTFPTSEQCTEFCLQLTHVLETRSS